MSETLVAPARQDVAGIDLTAALAEKVAAMRLAGLPHNVRTVAKQCLMDWIGVALAARGEPLVEILVADALEDAPATTGWSLIGRPERLSASQAALVNGAMGHALDFDDAHFAMGHPTCPVAPVALGLAESRGASGADMLEAFIAGVETECRVGRFVGPSHYARGWHTTATTGTFGAAAAAARMMGLSAGQITHAFGLAGTQAAGLKSVFGTMTKPLHAGKAAQSGLLAARLAARGFTSCTDILTVEQGLGDTQSDAPDVAAALENPQGGYHLPDTLFKYHASCYLTHSGIEAADGLARDEGFRPDEIEAVLLSVGPTHLKVCNIEAPRTGLECKFSLRMTAALGLFGEDTASEALFSDRTAARPELIALRDRVRVEATSVGTRVTVEVRLKDGRVFTRTEDTGHPMRDLDRQQEKLELKFRRLVTPVVGAERADAIVAMLKRLDDEPDVHGLVALLRPA